MSKPLFSWMVRDLISAQAWQDEAEKRIARIAKDPNISGELRDELTEALADIKASRRMMREVMAQHENVVENYVKETKRNGRARPDD